MKYLGFVVSNYKGIKSITLPLKKRSNSKITTFIGLNESGKTTLLEAISSLTNDLPDEKMHELIPKHSKANFTDTIDIKAQVELNKINIDELNNIFQKEGWNISNITELYITKSSAFKYSEHSGTSWTTSGSIFIKKNRGTREYDLFETEDLPTLLTEYVRSKLPSIVLYSNFLFDFPTKIYLEPFPKESKEQSFYRSVMQDILDAINESLNIETHIIARLNSPTESSKDSLESVITKMAQIVNNKILREWNDIFKSRGKEIKLEAKTEKTPTDEGMVPRHYLEWGIKEGSNPYKISERSLGFKWFFAFMLFTEFRKYRSKQNNTMLFLLDEPASNLHSTAQMKLLKTFDNIVSSNCELLYATHSHFLINPKYLSSAYIVRNKSLDYNDDSNYTDADTDVEVIKYSQFVSENPDKTTYFQPALDSLDYRPGLLEEIPSIVIPEGRNDFYTLSYVNNLVLSNKYNDLHLFPPIGPSKINEIVSLYIAWGRNFLVIFDDDEEGKKMCDQLKLDFGSIVEQKIITLKDLSSNFAGRKMEDMFSRNDKLKIIKEFEPSAKVVKKDRFNRAIENLLVEEKKVTLEKQTKKDFEILLEAIRDHMKD